MVEAQADSTSTDPNISSTTAAAENIPTSSSYCNADGVPTIESSSPASSLLLRHRSPRTRHQQQGSSRVALPRMIDRNLPFHQSRNKMNVRNLDPKRYLWRLQMIDWFHTLLRLPACLSVGVLLLLWITMVSFFAVLYWYEDHYFFGMGGDCGLGITDTESISFSGAFAFSLETCTTVGYGLPGSSTSFFEKGCSAIQGTIFFEMVCSMMFNAFMFAFFFSLLSKSEYRSSQIIFTNKLLVNVENDENQHQHQQHQNQKQHHSNKAYIRLQCYDIDSAHPLVEAHARMYFLDHRLKMHPLRLMDPNDELGGVLYPSVPADIAHHIDHHSALCPPKFHNQNIPLVQSSHGMVLRSLDSYTGNRDEIICPVCGESYGTYERWKQHFLYASMVEAREGYPPETSHCGFVVPPEPEPITLSDIQQHIEHTVSEIIVVVEAIDPQLSGTFQSLQSYKYEDIVFGEEFEKCMSTKLGQYQQQRNKYGRPTSSSSSVVCVNMDQFHATAKNNSSSSKSRITANALSSPTTSLRDWTKTKAESFADSRNESFLSEIQEEYTGEDSLAERNSNHDERSHGSIEPPKKRNDYFHRSYDTFRTFRRNWGGSGSSSETSHSRREGEEEEEGNTIVHDRMPPYTSIV